MSFYCHDCKMITQCTAPIILKKIKWDRYHSTAKCSTCGKLKARFLNALHLKVQLPELQEKFYYHHDEIYSPDGNKFNLIEQLKDVELK